MRLVVVDDDLISREMLRNLLESEGYKVETASDGEEGWNLIRHKTPRIVVTDWEMPGLNGIELCKRIRNGHLDRYVYVIMLTARGKSEEIVAGLEAGADDFVIKPFNPPELKVRLRAAERVLGLETRDITIFALAKLAESRDPETGAHLERIQSYCRILSEALFRDSPYREMVTPDFIRMIVATSPLHDIGKVGIPDSILLKPGSLNCEEFDIMRQHTVIGGETLSAAVAEHPQAEYLRMAYEIAISHHEYFNGKGYPQGLASLDIPLSARIISVADVYDALTSKRVYKEAFTHVVARNIITEEAGKQFDKVVVDAFLASEKEFIDAKKRINSTAVSD